MTGGAGAGSTEVITASGTGYTLELRGRFALATSAMAAMDEYRRQYHPAGYGTQFEPLRQDGDWFVVRGSRGRSCD